MKKYIYILLSFTMLNGCDHTIQNNSNNTDDYYFAKKFGDGVSNRITIEDLDSLLSSLTVQRLNEYKSLDSIERIGIKIVNEELNRRGINVTGLVISDYKLLNDSVAVFTICHLDDLVYTFNWSKMDPLPPPITGNVSGYEGWYYVNIKRNEAKFHLAQ